MSYEYGNRFARFADEYANVAAWLHFANLRDNPFAESLISAVQNYGRLTANQLAAVERNIARDVERSSVEKAAPTVNQDKLMAAFDHARANKLTRLKIRFDGFFCYPASESSVNAGGVYVKSDAREYLGKIKDGRFVKSYDCSADLADKIARVMADPLAEAVAYGKQTGNCAICGRFLENAESVQRGIGPICAAKYGFI